jgi:hypothetical protein
MREGWKLREGGMAPGSRNKGKRGEREVVALAKQHGLQAQRTWQTAQSASPSERTCDVRIEGRTAQLRIRADGFGLVYDALEAVEIAGVMHLTNQLVC